VVPGAKPGIVCSKAERRSGDRYVATRVCLRPGAFSLEAAYSAPWDLGQTDLSDTTNVLLGGQPSEVAKKHCI